jgi:hypothetical protein
MSAIQRQIRLVVPMTAEELRSIDDWRFANRAPSRAAALREIMRRGMSAPADPEDAVQ